MSSHHQKGNVFIIYNCSLIKYGRLIVAMLSPLQGSALTSLPQKSPPHPLQQSGTYLFPQSFPFFFFFILNHIPLLQDQSSPLDQKFHEVKFHAHQFNKCPINMRWESVDTKECQVGQRHQQCKLLQEVQVRTKEKLNKYKSIYGICH